MAVTGKQLICPECEQVMGTASWQLFTGLRIMSPDGFRLTPVSNDLMFRSTEQRLASASAQDRPEASRRREFVLSHPGDRLYDIKCPNGHNTLTTAPLITKAIRRTPGNWVTLTRPLLTEL
jgi:hypothetical protein